MRDGERVGDPPVFIPNGIGRHAAEAGDTGDTDGRHAGGERIVGQAGNPKIFRDVETRAADLIESGVEIAIVGNAQLIQLGRRDQPGVGEDHVLLALRLVLAEVRVGVHGSGEAYHVLDAVSAKQPVIRTDVVVDARKALVDRKSTRLNSSHSQISYAVFCLKKKKNDEIETSTTKLKKRRMCTTL